jgi:ribosomal protein L37E
MTDRRRFSHLEGPRPARPDADAPERSGVSVERIAGVERPGAGAPSAARGARTPTGAQLERFDPEPEPVIELADTDGRRPFTRCRRCGMDSNVFVTVCAGCGVGLDTAEQRAFDERFWSERAVAEERQAQAAAEREALRARADAELAEARRAMGESLAREVGERERRRLGGGWGPDGYQDGFDGTPLGLRLLRRISDPRWQWAALAGGLAVILGLIAHGYLASPRHRGPTLGLGLALLFALVVPWTGRSRWRRWW